MIIMKEAGKWGVCAHALSVATGWSVPLPYPVMQYGVHAANQ